MTRSRLTPLALLLAAAVALPPALAAQSPNDVYKLPTQDPEVLAAQMGRTQPGVAASSPIGFGPGRGDVFVGVGYQGRNTAGVSDGAISVGGGFLDPNATVGIEAVLTSLSTIRSGLGDRVVGSLKVHRVVNQWGLGLGVEGIYLNGNEFDTDPSIFFAGTRVVEVRDADTFNAATLNIGIGNGRFQSTEKFVAGESGVGVFASAALRVNDWSSAIIDYTGAQTNLALSFAPVKTMTLVITPSINDITGEAGKAARLALGVGMSWRY